MRRTAHRYPASVIRAVVFDVGECLVDETREYATWADWLGVPRHTFHAMFGAVIAQGRDYRETFQEFRPGFDLYGELEKRPLPDSRRALGKGICTRTSVPLSGDSGPRGCGSVSPATRPYAPGGSCVRCSLTTST